MHASVFKTVPYTIHKADSLLYLREQSGNTVYLPVSKLVCLHADFFLLDAIKMLIETKATPLFGDQASNAIWYAVSLDTASSLVYVHRQRGLAGTQDLQCDKKGAGAEKECILF